MNEYEPVFDTVTGKLLGVIRLADHARIPVDMGNRDWVAFLRWNANQETPIDLTDKVIVPETPEEATARVRAETVAAMPTLTDTSSMVTRASFATLLAIVNEARVAARLAPVSQAEFIAQVERAIMAGAGEPKPKP